MDGVEIALGSREGDEAELYFIPREHDAPRAHHSVIAERVRSPFFVDAVSCLYCLYGSGALRLSSSRDSSPRAPTWRATEPLLPSTSSTTGVSDP